MKFQTGFYTVHKLEIYLKSSIAARTFHPSTWDAEAVDLLDFKASLVESRPTRAT